MKAFSVNLWGCQPGTDDCCWEGVVCDTLQEAEALYEDPFGHRGFSESYCRSVYGELWIELDGPDCHRERQLQKARPQAPQAPEDDEGLHEQAMQAGMEFGVEAYNETMGWC